MIGFRLTALRTSGCRRGARGCIRHGAIWQRRALAASADHETPSRNAAQDSMVSPEPMSKTSRTSAQLFQECLDNIRRAKLEADPDVDTRPSPVIEKLAQDEIELTRKIFQRLDPDQKVTSNLEHKGQYIDPYWSPFKEVQDLRSQVAAEFDEYSQLVTVAEQRRLKHQLKKSLRRNARLYDPYSDESKKLNGLSNELPPQPHRLSDKYWEPTPLKAALAKETITWRDVDIIQHFIAENGYILPRRTTMLSRKKQADLVRAVRTAQRMALIPYDWKSPDYTAMPLMDPLQWMVDRLTDSYIEARDLRAQAMIRVMMERYPQLNYRNYLRHESQKRHKEQKQSEHQ